MYSVARECDNGKIDPKVLLVFLNSFFTLVCDLTSSSLHLEKNDLA